MRFLCGEIRFLFVVLPITVCLDLGFVATQMVVGILLILGDLKL
jgi:hypothetical protein